MLSVIIAPDSFKGTLTAGQVCDIIEKAFKDKLPDSVIRKLPLADGGEGFCACMQKICGGEMIKCTVTGVFGEPVTAGYLMLPDKTAVIEMAACAGLPLAGGHKNPGLATTRGVGELITDAVKNGAESVLLGLGGSATNDCGCGMAAALGYVFSDAAGNKIEPVGLNLRKIRKIVPPDVKISIPVTAACDVENPLFGENGAAFVFAPQKGAGEAMVRLLDDGLQNMADVIKSHMGIDVSMIPGAGAAGGLGAGAVAFLGADLKKGIDIILDKSGYCRLLDDADIVITGEGRLDGQSLQGKVISGVARMAVKNGKRVITICGCKGEGYEKAFDLGIERMYFSCNEPKPFSEVLENCRQDLYDCASYAAGEI